ncbi:hypothetical protein [Methyloceanibacter sp.]|uniref:hypothetical protein n=1 Tax=Methyloceanibacter sp. TaxID=1965321 RepID=UPI003D6CBC3F
MEIVLANDAFAGVGGSETYLLTVAEHLQRLGHEPTIYARICGPMADLAIARGVPVARQSSCLPSSCDVVVAQDGAMAYELGERWPEAPQVFVAHSPIFDLQLPPVFPGVASAIVVLSDRVEQRIRAMAGSQEIVRLRQPIDAERLFPRGAPRSRPQRALLLGNYLQADVRRVISDAWKSMGVEIVQVGQPTTELLDPESEIAAADIVVGKGRAVLDAMACGRPAYIYDMFGADGWVTPEHYHLQEADGFAGLALPVVLDEQKLRRDLNDYDPLMGQANRKLILMHHLASTHVHELVGLFRRLAPRAPAPTLPHREFARLIRLRWGADAELIKLRLALASMSEKINALTTELEVNHERSGTEDAGLPAHARQTANLKEH